MTVAPRPKRRSRPSVVARLRRFWLLGGVLAVVLGWGGFALARAPAFRLHDFAVTGLSHVSRDEVVARAAIDPRANVWLLDPRSIARRIEAIPYVATAKIHRRPFGSVWAEVAERSIDGCVRARGGASLTVDRSGRILELGCSGASERAYLVRKLPHRAAGEFLRDPELAALQRDAEALSTGGGDRYRAFRHDAYGGLEADLPSGIRIKFGDDRDLERKRKLIGPILAELGPRVADLRGMDLRAPTTPVVEFVPPTPTPAASPKQSPEHTQYTQGVHRAHHNM